MRPKKVILCVDDNEQVLSVRTFLLETRGYRVLTATNANDALDILSKLTPGTLDLLIADLLLSGADGNELVRRAKQMHPSLPALIVSGTVTAYERALAADAFLPKGAGSPVELLDKIRVMVARKRGPQEACPAGPAAARQRLRPTCQDRAAARQAPHRQLAQITQLWPSAKVFLP